MSRRFLALPGLPNWTLGTTLPCQMPISKQTAALKLPPSTRRDLERTQKAISKIPAAPPILG
jgi:hypothetical protein